MAKFFFQILWKINLYIQDAQYIPSRISRQKHAKEHHSQTEKKRGRESLENREK